MPERKIQEHVTSKKERNEQTKIRVGNSIVKGKLKITVKIF